MIGGRRFAVAIAVAAAVMLLAGTAYAGALTAQPRQSMASFAGCGTGPVAGMHATMWESLAVGLGMTVQGLDAALSDGSSLADVAAQQGIDSGELAGRMLAAMEMALDEQVAQGALSLAEAQAMLDLARIHMTPERIALMGSSDAHMVGPWGGGLNMSAMHRSMHGEDISFDIDSMREDMQEEWGRRWGPCHEDPIDGAEYQPRRMMGRAV
jgi:hypothetical protein